MVLVLAIAAPAALAQESPRVILDPPDGAQRVTLRVFTQLRDCTGRPTVSILAAWKNRTGEARIRVQGFERAFGGSPTPRQTADLLTFPRVRVVRGWARARVSVVTNWLKRPTDKEPCRLTLPRLVETGTDAGQAQRGFNRLRSSLEIERQPKPGPQRTTATDHIWACGGGRQGRNNCGVLVRFVDPRRAEAKPKDDDDGDEDPPAGLAAALAAATGLGLAGAAAASRRRPTQGGDVPDSWDKIARDEYAKPDEPVSARATDLTKFGGPAAALITAVLAGVAAHFVDAPEAETVIGVSIIAAVAVGGVFYVFAQDLRTRAAVSVARLETLGKIMESEATANADTQKAADEATKLAEQAQKDAAEERAETDNKLEKVHERERDIAAKEEAATAAAAAAEAKRKAAEAERDEAHAALERCRERAAAAPGTECCPTYLPLDGISAVASGQSVVVYGVESSEGKVARYLVVGPDRRIRWVAEAEVEEPPAAT